MVKKPEDAISEALERQRAENLATYKRLSERIAKDGKDRAVQRTFSRDTVDDAGKTVKGTQRGFDTTGLIAQFVINRFNEELGTVEWGFKPEIVHVVEGHFKSGQPYFAVTMAIHLWVGDKSNIRTGYGGDVKATFADAVKGGMTDGFKRAARWFGVGREAYEHAIDVDAQPRGGAEDDMREGAAPPAAGDMGTTCRKCDAIMVEKLGTNGPFLKCPACGATSDSRKQTSPNMKRIDTWLEREGMLEIVGKIGPWWKAQYKELPGQMTKDRFESCATKMREAYEKMGPGNKARANNFVTAVTAKINDPAGVEAPKEKPAGQVSLI